MTGPSVGVVIAYRDKGCPHRRRAYDYVREYYRALGLPVTVRAGASDEDFTRARTTNEAIRAADCDILVHSDPDSVVPPAALREAIRLASEADGLVVPHDRYLYLTEAATRTVYTGVSPFLLGPDDCEVSGPNGVGNVLVFSRETWEAAGHYDERFGMWGGDDAVFAYSTGATSQPLRRLAGDMVHLYHPRLPQSEPGHPEYQRQFAIIAEYRDAAARGDEHVRELVRQRRETGVMT